MLMTDHEGQLFTSPEMVRAHLPVMLQTINTISLAVIAASTVHIGAHIHEATHEGMIWRDPPAENAAHGHHH